MTSFLTGDVTVESGFGNSEASDLSYEKIKFNFFKNSFQEYNQCVESAVAQW